MVFDDLSDSTISAANSHFRTDEDYDLMNGSQTNHHLRDYCAARNLHSIDECSTYTLDRYVIRPSIGCAHDKSPNGMVEIGPFYC